MGIIIVENGFQSIFIGTFLKLENFFKRLLYALKALSRKTFRALLKFPEK
jgi:hypothetical protein